VLDVYVSWHINGEDQAWYVADGTAVYPPVPGKVAALKESINTTEFWDNLIGRINADGDPEIAYGHNRLAALREVFGSNHEISLNIRKLDDAKMLQIMIRENEDEYNTDFPVLMEAVHATVNAIAAGQIPQAIAKTKQPAQQRYAPSFVMGKNDEDSSSFPYTLDSIAGFMAMTYPNGQASTKIRAAVGALELVEEGSPHRRCQLRDWVGLVRSASLEACFGRLI
jgi:hypothetical protein